MSAEKSQEQVLKQIGSFNEKELRIAGEIYELTNELESELKNLQTGSNDPAFLNRIDCLDALIEGALSKAIKEETSSFDFAERSITQFQNAK